MPKFVGPVVEKLVAVLKQYTPGELAGREEFQEFGKQFTGVAKNLPAVWVTPARTAFDEESTGTRRQAHLVVIRFGVTGAEPDELMDAAMAYMRAIDAAIAKSETERDWEDAVAGGVVQRVYVSEHDYGPLFERGNVLARFPELGVVVEVEEVP